MTDSRKRPEVPIPEHMQSLSLTDRGYLKPWFVKADDFRVVDGEKAWLAVSKKKCWICGNDFALGEYGLVGDAVSATVRVCKEPPCHVECATYALQVCPFILYPNAKRREVGLEEEEKLQHNNKKRQLKIDPQNPGKYYLIIVKDFTYTHADQLMTFYESDIVERQYWIGGSRQESVPDPILPLDKLSLELQNLYHQTNR